MAELTLGAVLIVRDEEADLPACLASLRGLVDEVVVHDTGSRDRTVEVARARGARVSTGGWDGDFARARNEALARSRTTWVLSVDADERAEGDGRRLRRVLAATAADAVCLTVRNLGADGDDAAHEHPAPRLLRRATTRWKGAVHEQPVRRDGRPAAGSALPDGVLRLDHLGYRDAARARAKALRNADLARRDLERLLAAGHGFDDDVLDVALDLGRSLHGAGDLQGATEVYELLRAQAPASRYAVEGTSMLCEALLAADQPAPVLVLVGDLEGAGCGADLCAWLRARALAGLGRHAEALTLLRGVTGLVDNTGRQRRYADVLQARAALAARLGLVDEAVSCLLRAMLEEGAVAGCGRVLLRLWGSRPPAHLAELVASYGSPATRARVAAELATCAAPGPAVAAAVLAAAAVPAGAS